MVNKIIALYGERFLKRSAIRLSGGDVILKHYIDLVKPETIVEIGTFRGATAAYLSQFCNVLTFDVADFKQHKFWESLGIHNITGFILPADQIHKEIVRHDFEMAFIDGDHACKAVRKDFKVVRKCGNVLFHDYIDNGPNSGVMEFVNTLWHIEVIDNFAYWHD